MSVDTDIISTTDLRKWVEDMTAPGDDIPCDVTITKCPNEAVCKIVMSCGCKIPACVFHRDLMLAGPAAYGAYYGHDWVDDSCWHCPKHNVVVIIRVDPLR